MTTNCRLKGLKATLTGSPVRAYGKSATTVPSTNSQYSSSSQTTGLKKIRIDKAVSPEKFQRRHLGKPG